MSARKRRVSVSLPSGNDSTSLAMDSGKRYQPGYSLASIQPSSTNPRRSDLNQAGVTLDRVKQLAKSPSEGRESFQDRMEQWIEQQSFSQTAEGVWRNLMTLALSIHEARGVIQPVTVRVDDESDSIATLIAGERRFMASWLAGMDGIDVIIRTTGDPSLHEALIENTQRQDLSLSALITALQDYQLELEKPLSVRDIVALTGHSRGSATVIRQALALESDHPAHQALLKGEATRVHHLQKLIKPRASETSQNEGGASTTASDANVASQPAGENANTGGTSAAGTDEGPASNASSDGKTVSGQGRETSNKERPNLDMSKRAPETDNTSSASSSADEWPLIRQWLHEHLTEDPDGYWAARIDAVTSTMMLHALIRDMASAKGNT